MARFIQRIGQFRRDGWQAHREAQSLHHERRIHLRVVQHLRGQLVARLGKLRAGFLDSGQLSQHLLAGFGILLFGNVTQELERQCRITARHDRLGGALAYLVLPVPQSGTKSVFNFGSARPAEGMSRGSRRGRLDVPPTAIPLRRFEIKLGEQFQDSRANRRGLLRIGGITGQRFDGLKLVSFAEGEQRRVADGCLLGVQTRNHGAPGVAFASSDAVESRE